MMSKTHIAAGVAASLLVLQPHTAAACIPVILGGAIGGLVSDVDIRANHHSRDAAQGRVIDAVLAAVLLLADWATAGQLREYFLAHLGAEQIVGVVLFLGVSAIGMLTAHRTFTHSLLGLVLFSGALWLACAPVVPAFAVGFVSHVLLDTTNKTPVRVLYPLRRGVSLGLCRADGTVNEVLLVAGILVVGAYLGMMLVE